MTGHFDLHASRVARDSARQQRWGRRDAFGSSLLAATDAMTRITEMVGSGPYRA
jgi:hypothetical protein